MKAYLAFVAHVYTPWVTIKVSRKVMNMTKTFQLEVIKMHIERLAHSLNMQGFRTYYVQSALSPKRSARVTSNLRVYQTQFP